MKAQIGLVGLMLQSAAASVGRTQSTPSAGCRHVPPGDLTGEEALASYRASWIAAIEGVSCTLRASLLSLSLSLSRETPSMVRPTALTRAPCLDMRPRDPEMRD